MLIEAHPSGGYGSRSLFMNPSGQSGKERLLLQQSESVFIEIKLFSHVGSSSRVH
jgi:hypothetical protein